MIRNNTIPHNFDAVIYQTFNFPSMIILQYHCTNPIIYLNHHEFITSNAASVFVKLLHGTTVPLCPLKCVCNQLSTHDLMAETNDIQNLFKVLNLGL